MLARLMGRLSDGLDQPVPVLADSLPFTDSINDWAYDNVRTMYGSGIMAGTSATTFEGGANYTIEQSIVTIMRIGGWYSAGV